MTATSQGQYAQDEFIGEEQGNQISNVVVFQGQAYITRKARVNAKPGMNRFCLETKAFRIDNESAQAAVFGEGEILSVQYKEIPVKDAPQEHVKNLEDEKDQLLQKRKGMQRRQKALDKQLKFLDSVIGFAEAEVPKKLKTRFPTTENLQTMVEFLGENYVTMVDKRGELEYQIEELNKEIAVVEEKLRIAGGSGAKTRRVIEVLFQSTNEQQLNIEVSYVVFKAGWYSVYKVDVPMDLSGISMTMFARIFQKTGEDWRNINLSVSNATPVAGSRLPEPESWYLSFRPPHFPGAAVAMAAGAPMGRKGKEGGDTDLEMDALADAPLEMAMEEAAPEAEFSQAVMKDLPLAFEYDLPRPVTLDSGGDETILPLYSKEMEGNFYVYSVPKIDLLAYLVCSAKPDRALLAGKLNVHFGGRFVGGTTLSEKKAGEDLLINLGVERGVKVQREKMTDKVTESFFGVVDRLSKARELRFRLTIENLKDEAVRVKILDSVPVSKTDKIQVKGMEIKPDPSKKNYLEREGVMLWDLKMEPESVQKIGIKFHVKHPKDQPPHGL